MREWAVSRGVVSRSWWCWGASKTPTFSHGRFGDRLFRSVGAPWWVGCSGTVVSTAWPRPRQDYAAFDDSALAELTELVALGIGPDVIPVTVSPVTSTFEIV